MWTLLPIILAIFLPPLAVFLMVGVRTPFWINLISTGGVHGWLGGDRGREETEGPIRT